jgi:hypothetical protein
MTIVAMEIIDNSIRTNRTHRLRSELEALEAGELNPGIQSRIQQIERILADIEKDQLLKNTDMDRLQDHKRKMKEAVYKARWHTLTVDQQVNRLNEYLERALVLDQKILTRLREMVRTSELKSKDIEYRIDMGKIISIKILEAEDGRFVLNDPKTKSKSRSKSASKAKATKAKASKAKATKAKASKTKVKATKSRTKTDDTESDPKPRTRAKPKAKPKAKAKAKPKARATKAKAKKSTRD